MDGCMLHYYFLKRTIDYIPDEIKKELEYNDDLLFNLSGFNDIGVFFRLFNPFIRDKYKINEQLKDDKFNRFITECILTAKKNDDFKSLLFIYAMVSNNIFNNYLIPYVKQIKTNKLSIDKALNMLDVYYSLKEDNMNLSKLFLADRFKDGFIYYDYMENLIHNPLVKVYSFFGSNAYFTKAYKRKKYFYSHMTKSGLKIKKLGYILYDAIFNHFGKKKAKDYLYYSKTDTRLLNLNNQEYTINGKSYNNTFDELFEKILNENIKFINAINDFVFLNKDNQLRMLLNIPKQYKL